MLEGTQRGRAMSRFVSRVRKLGLSHYSTESVIDNLLKRRRYADLQCLRKSTDRRQQTMKGQKTMMMTT